jgi:threonine/homoserine/homoserine lactone efflux protein
MELFITIAITHFLALLAPGADFFLILKTVIEKGKTSAKYTCLGIAVGNAIILMLIYLSLYLLVQVDTDLIFFLKWLGIIYFAYLAFQCLRSGVSAQTVQDISDDKIKKMWKSSDLRYFGLGLLSSLLNVKNLMFYTVLVILIYPKYNFIQNILLCIWMVALVLIWNVAILSFLSSNVYLSWLKRHFHHVYFLAGISFIFFMIVLIMS